ncbi:hypothetical protein [Wukongibacter sp. M2B1]|uniref:hypothetical protein n=1 Tax=Wukongibacter sp. M2B1 TaxID=3088895 RepID=UPI003D78DAEA
MNEESEKIFQDILDRRKGTNIEWQRFYIPFTILATAFLFYYSVRFYLKKYKNFEIPLKPERYHDNTRMNIIQAVILMTGIFIGSVIVRVIF